MKKVLLMSLCVLVAGTVAMADWRSAQIGEVEDPAKWVQYPDITPEGMDVNATHPMVLADDFECTDPGEITSIHIWGSWWNDMPPMDPQTQVPVPGLVDFRLSIHEDIPVGDPRNNFTYSIPGDLLKEWTISANTFQWRVYYVLQNLGEGWYDPSTGVYQPDSDNVIYQYNFDIPAGDRFLQQGTPENPIVYWLDVEAIPVAGGLFGWKTAAEHWNDDAVWSNGPADPWNELRYPDGHPRANLEWPENSIDLSFVIVPEPATMSLLLIGGLAILRRRR